MLQAILDHHRYEWVDAELGAPRNACVLFAGELLGPWSDGRLIAPLHFVNESHQIAAQLGATSNAVHGAGGDGARHSYPFFFRP
eukprot:SAG31_NODE_9033_length_1345_cov_1.360353_1_plen_83_part_10